MRIDVVKRPLECGACPQSPSDRACASVAPQPREATCVDSCWGCGHPIHLAAVRFGHESSFVQDSWRGINDAVVQSSVNVPTISYSLGCAFLALTTILKMYSPCSLNIFRCANDHDLATACLSPFERTLNKPIYSGASQRRALGSSESRAPPSPR